MRKKYEENKKELQETERRIREGSMNVEEIRDEWEVLVAKINQIKDKRPYGEKSFRHPPTTVIGEEDRYFSVCNQYLALQ